MKTAIVFLGLVLFLSGCSKKLHPDRSQFLKDGKKAPTVNLSYYKSVQERPGQDPELAVAMAISGGGARAANFAIGIMLGLEKILAGDSTDVLDQIDYLSTVSGGGFAAGAYIGARYEHNYFQKKEPFSLEAYVNDHIRDDLKFSYTGVLLRANFNPRLWFSKIDDGDALEKAIDDQVLGLKRRKIAGEVYSITLGDLFIDKDSLNANVKYPMHFANSSVLSTWAIFPFSPAVLKQYHINGYTHRKRRVMSDSLSPYHIPLAVGIKASGSFPALISNTTLRSSFHEKRRFLHLIDGGMSDNLGYYTALEILKQDTASHKVLFMVDADAAGNRYTFSKREAAALALSVYARLASSGLNARKIIFEKEIEELEELLGIKPIYFSFNVLIRENGVSPPEKLDLKAEQQRLIKLLRADIDNLSPEDLQILYELLTGIGTKYTIKEKEQELLLLAGRKIVMMMREEILKAMKK